MSQSPTAALKKQNITRMILLLAILVLANIVAGFLFARIDLTEEKRYSLSESSIQLAGQLDDVVYFRIYLDGDLPPGFRRLRNSLKEMLDEYRVHAGDNIEYEFIDPADVGDETQRNSLYRQLAEKGLFPTNLEEKGKDSQSSRIIFPGAIVNYKSKEYALQLLKSRIGSSPAQMLNSSVESLEYEISSLLRKISIKTATNVGFLQGHGELDPVRLTEVMNSLSEFYKTDTIQIRGQLRALDDLHTLVIAGPDSAFSEEDKFIIDQFIMRGGSVLWLLDKMIISMDSLSATSTTVSIPYEINLDDMLFRYGARLNADLVMDLQAAPIPIVTGYVGNQPRQEIFPWYYFPLLNAEASHPVVRNLNAIKCEFVSSLDTIEVPGVKKTILLRSSKFSRLQYAPARVSLNILQDEPDPALYNKGNIPVAVLLEGTFTSNYLNRIPKQLSESPEIGFRKESAPAKMIVAADADIIANHVSKKGVVFPLGYDRITGQTYGNKSFIMNCIDYLTGNTAILDLRSKEFKLRLLDPEKTSDTTFIRWLNISLPVLLLVVAGILFNIFRRKKFSSIPNRKSSE